MDSDDVSRPDRFAVQSEFLDTHKDVAVIGAYIQEFSDICENLGVRQVIMWQILIKFFLILGETILFISVDQIGRIVILNLKFTKKEYINYLEFLLINRYFQ